MLVALGESERNRGTKSSSGYVPLIDYTILNLWPHWVDRIIHIILYGISCWTEMCIATQSKTIRLRPVILLDFWFVINFVGLCISVGRSKMSELKIFTERRKKYMKHTAGFNNNNKIEGNKFIIFIALSKLCTWKKFFFFLLLIKNYNLLVLIKFSFQKVHPRLTIHHHPWLLSTFNK